MRCMPAEARFLPPGERTTALVDVSGVICAVTCSNWSDCQSHRPMVKCCFTCAQTTSVFGYLVNAVARLRGPYEPRPQSIGTNALADWGQEMGGRHVSPRFCSFIWLKPVFVIAVLSVHSSRNWGRLSR